MILVVRTVRPPAPISAVATTVERSGTSPRKTKPLKTAKTTQAWSKLATTSGRGDWQTLAAPIAITSIRSDREVIVAHPTDDTPNCPRHHMHDRNTRAERWTQIGQRVTSSAETLTIAPASAKPKVDPRMARTPGGKAFNRVKVGS